MERLRPARRVRWMLPRAYRAQPQSVSRAGLRESAYEMVGQYDDTDRDEEIINKLKKKMQKPSESSRSLTRKKPTPD